MGKTNFLYFYTNFLFQARSYRESSLEWLKRSAPSVIWGYVFRIAICWFSNSKDNNLLTSKCCLQIIKRYIHRWETWRCTWNWITRRRREKRWLGKVLVSPVLFPPPPQPLGPPPQPPPLSHLQLPHDCQIWTGKEQQTFFERISDLFPRIAVITPPQTSNPFTDLKPTFNQGLQEILAR